MRIIYACEIKEMLENATKFGGFFNEASNVNPALDKNDTHRFYTKMFAGMDDTRKLDREELARAIDAMRDFGRYLTDVNLATAVILSGVDEGIDDALLKLSELSVANSGRQERQVAVTEAIEHLWGIKRLIVDLACQSK